MHEQYNEGWNLIQDIAKEIGGDPEQWTGHQFDEFEMQATAAKVAATTESVQQWRGTYASWVDILGKYAKGTPSADDWNESLGQMFLEASPSVEDVLSHSDIAPALTRRVSEEQLRMVVDLVIEDSYEAITEVVQASIEHTLASLSKEGRL